jgi:hypothetical protein
VGFNSNLDIMLDRLYLSNVHVKNEFDAGDFGGSIVFFAPPGASVR